jgi:hypothetical protein
MLHPKKVATLPVKGSDEEKQTNEIKIAIPLLDCIDIQGKAATNVLCDVFGYGSGDTA